MFSRLFGTCVLHNWTKKNKTETVAIYQCHLGLDVKLNRPDPCKNEEKNVVTNE